MSLLSLPATLGQLLLKWATAKYIEAAGSAEEMAARAKTVKGLATGIDGAVLGTMTIAQLQAVATADLAGKSLKASDQILINGLVGLISSVLPAADSGFLNAAVGAEVNLFLQDVIAVCTEFGA